MSIRTTATAIALIVATSLPLAVRAQSHADPMSRAFLFGAAFAKSDLSTDQGGGMAFVPGRGLIRWETRGKTLAEQEELKTEAIGLADARAERSSYAAAHAPAAPIEPAAAAIRASFRIANMGVDALRRLEIIGVDQVFGCSA